MSFFNLPSAHIYHITGKDCTRYLNARLSNNVRDLLPLHGLAAAALSPQGRTDLFGTLLKITADEYYFVCDGGDATENQSILMRYKVADRVDCALLSNLLLLHITGENPYQQSLLALSEFQPYQIDHGYAFLHQRTSKNGCDLIVTKEQAHQLTIGQVEMSSEQQRVERIKAHRPTFPTELNSENIFLEAGLSHAISFTKGCYVGQEVMEKVDSHGRLPYSIVSIVSRTAVSPPLSEAAVQRIEAVNEKIGTVVCSALELESGLSYCFVRLKTALLNPGQRLLIDDIEYGII